jgi:hypothetical protein
MKARLRLLHLPFYSFKAYIVFKVWAEIHKIAGALRDCDPLGLKKVAFKLFRNMSAMTESLKKIIIHRGLLEGVLASELHRGELVSHGDIRRSSVIP